MLLSDVVWRQNSDACVSPRLPLSNDSATLLRSYSQSFRIERSIICSAVLAAAVVVLLPTSLIYSTLLFISRCCVSHTNSLPRLPSSYSRNDFNRQRYEIAVRLADSANWTALRGAPLPCRRGRDQERDFSRALLSADNHILRFRMPGDVCQRPLSPAQVM